MNRPFLLHSLIPVSVTALIIVGCATIMTVITDPVDPVPEDKPFLLSSDPQKSGLLIVSVDVILDPSFDIFRDNLVDEGLSRLLGPTVTTGFIKGLKVTNENGLEFSSRLFDTEKEAFSDPSTDLFVVFDGLPQGVYRISAASATFSLSNSERKEYFDCEYKLKTNPVTSQIEPEWSSLDCPYRADVGFSIEEGADSAFGPIHISNGQVNYVGFLTIIENHRLSDYGTERKKIDGWWHVVLDHRHSIEKIIKSDPRLGVEKKVIYELASDNLESGWQAILQGRDRPAFD